MMHIIISLLLIFAVVVRAESCPTGNLLRNGGFEAHRNSLRPWMTQGEGARIIRPGFDSKQSAGISSSMFENAGILQQFKACSGIPLYLFEIDVYFASPVFIKDDSGFVDVLISNLQLALHGDPTNNGTWTSYKQLIYASAADAYGADIDLDNTSKGGSAQIDNVKVTAFGEVALEPDAKNLVQNPGFEASTLGPWHGHGCALVSPGAKGQGQAAECTQTASLVQTIDTIPGRLYDFTFDYNLMLLNRNRGSVDQLCSINFYFNRQYQYFGPSIGSPFAMNNTWSRAEQPFYAASNQTELILQASPSMGKEDGTCRVEFDNVSIKEGKRVAAKN